MAPVPRIPVSDHTDHVCMTTTGVRGKLYSDHTGHFPLTENRGASIVIIFYCAEGNYIKSYSVIPNDTSIKDQVEIPSFFANIIYECENTDQLIQFYHATI